MAETCNLVHACTIHLTACVSNGNQGAYLNSKDIVFFYELFSTTFLVIDFNAIHSSYKKIEQLGP